MRNDARPEINGTIENFDEYDVIYVGYPIWNADLPPIINTFLEQYNFDGKTVVPFCTHGGSGLAGTPEATGKCVYCNHCEPCPMGLDIGLINKYYDLSKAGDMLAKDHYKNLEKTAKDCVSCGHCNERCPFKVDQMSRMKEIEAYFENL